MVCVFKAIRTEVISGKRSNNQVVKSTTILPIKSICIEKARSPGTNRHGLGIISGDRAELDTIKEYASIPSRDGLLTMIAAGMMKYARDLAIAINMYAEEKEKNN
jgi:ribosomal protein L10